LLLRGSLLLAERGPIVARGRRRGRTLADGGRACGRRLAVGRRWGGVVGAGRGTAKVVAGAAGASPARGVAGALGGLGFDLAHGLFQREALAGDLGLAQWRLHIAQLSDQRRARPLIERTTALAGGVGVQSGDSAGDQRVVIGHINSTVRAFQ
jgi:hypothetical protein